jgi:hypothetical protein
LRADCYANPTSVRGANQPELCRSRKGEITGDCIEELGMQIGALLLVNLAVQNAWE